MGILLVVGTISGLFAALKAIERWLRPPAELTRKLVHVGTGSIVLTFPWLFDRQWPVLLMSGLAAVMLLATKIVPRLRDGVGTLVTGVRRPTLGEVYFPVSVALLFWLSDRDKILYCVPMLIMTLADMAAALIGVAYGRVRYVTSEGLKSAEGSIAFFAIAFLSVHVPLLLFTGVDRAESLLIAVIIGVLSMLLEAIAWRGLDNLLIPLGAFFFLELYLDKSADDLLYRLFVTFALLIFAFSWRRRSSLDDSALMGGALFGYGAWMLGGGIWLIGPVLLFIAICVMWPRSGVRRDHSVFAVLSVISAALLWLVLFLQTRDNVFYIAYSVTFGVHLAIVGVSRISVCQSKAIAFRCLACAVAGGCLISLVQIAASATWSSSIPAVSLLMASFVGVTTGSALFYILRPVLYGHRGSDSRIYLAGFCSGLLGSSLTWSILSAMS
ncbi:MAG TPA: hypothetical protein VGB55_09455 [Tepidisphaeraceae bacterium]